jgi:heme/copper-type cytochrome/quinol oxidase subunit 3
MSVAHGEQIGALEEHGAVARSLNWWGMIFFIASEALIFANLIAAYLYLEVRGFQVPGGLWLLPSGEHLPVLFPAVNTVFLLGSSFPAIYARRSITRGNQKGLIMGLTGAIILGVILLGGQVYEYTTLFHEGFTLGYKTFGSAFFTLTGFHGLHVTIGVIILLVCLIRAIRGDFTANKHFAVEAGEMYWHFVDLVWVVVFSTVYLLPWLMIH